MQRTEHHEEASTCSNRHICHMKFLHASERKLCDMCYTCICSCQRANCPADENLLPVGLGLSRLDSLSLPGLRLLEAALDVLHDIVLQFQPNSPSAHPLEQSSALDLVAILGLAGQVNLNAVGCINLMLLCSFELLRFSWSSSGSCPTVGISSFSSSLSLSEIASLNASWRRVNMFSKKGVSSDSFCLSSLALRSKPLAVHEPKQSSIPLAHFEPCGSLNRLLFRDPSEP